LGGPFWAVYLLSLCFHAKNCASTHSVEFGLLIQTHIQQYPAQCGQDYKRIEKERVLKTDKDGRKKDMFAEIWSR